MFIEVEVVKETQQNEITVASVISKSRIINKAKIVTATNERMLCDDGEFRDTCEITFVNHESIRVFGNAKIVDDDIIIEDED